MNIIVCIKQVPDSTQVKVDPKTGKCTVYCSLTEKKNVIFEATLIVDSIDRARRMKANFDDRPEVIYRGFTALMAGNVNFLFD